MQTPKKLLLRAMTFIYVSLTEHTLHFVERKLHYSYMITALLVIAGLMLGIGLIDAKTTKTG